MKRQQLAPSIFTIRGVLTADECQQMIAFAEERGFDPATINAFGVQRRDEATRNNDRVIDDDFDWYSTYNAIAWLYSHRQQTAAFQDECPCEDLERGDKMATSAFGLL